MASSAMSGSLHVERMSIQVRCGWKGNETLDGVFPLIYQRLIKGFLIYS